MGWLFALVFGVSPGRARSCSGGSGRTGSRPRSAGGGSGRRWGSSSCPSRPCCTSSGGRRPGSPAGTGSGCSRPSPSTSARRAARPPPTGTAGPDPAPPGRPPRPEPGRARRGLRPGTLPPAAAVAFPPVHLRPRPRPGCDPRVSPTVSRPSLAAGAGGPPEAPVDVGRAARRGGAHVGRVLPLRMAGRCESIRRRWCRRAAFARPRPARTAARRRGPPPGRPPGAGGGRSPAAGGPGRCRPGG